MLEDMITFDGDEEDAPDNAPGGLIVGECLTSAEVNILCQMNRDPLAGAAAFVVFEDGEGRFSNAEQARKVFGFDWLPTMAEATRLKLMAAEVLFEEYRPALLGARNAGIAS